MIILQELKEMPVAGTPRSVTRDLIGGGMAGPGARPRHEFAARAGE